MLRNYLSVAVRNLLANRRTTAINLGGLAVGLAACLLILLFVRDEFTYDAWVPHGDRIAAVETTFFVPGRDKLAFAAAPGPLKDGLESSFASDLERVVRVYGEQQPARTGDRQLLLDTAYVDPGFFDVFDLPMVAGDRAAALADGGSIVLSQRTARRFFGDQPAVGATLSLADGHVMTVVGVFADLPRKSHLELDSIARFDPERYRDRPWVAEQWTSVNTRTYLLARTPAAIDRIAAAMPAFIDQHVHFDIPGIDGRPSTLMRLDLRRLRDIHLHADKPGYNHVGSYTLVMAFAGIALLILTIAAINFVNLATARATARAREVALRKVVGATRGQLVVQHLGEATLTALLALVVALALVELTLPAFNHFLHTELRLDLIGDPAMAAIALGLVVAVGVLGGLYPALYLSRFRPATVLKANRSSAHGSSWVRSGLVVFQFAISIALMVCTATIFLQTRYARTRDLGFAHAGRVTLGGLSDLPTAAAATTVARELAAMPGVQAVALSSDAPPLSDNNNTLFFPTPSTDGPQLLVETLRIDAAFFDAYGVKPLAGRLFSTDHPGDYQAVPYPGDAPPTGPAPADPGPQTQSVVVNQAMLPKLGVTTPEAAVGMVVYEVTRDGKPMVPTTVIGVVPDLHLRSLRIAVTPMVYYLGRPERGWAAATVVLAPGHGAETMRALEATWSRIAPTVPFQARSVDDALGALYAGDAQRAQIFAGFALFAVVIACLGLFGLAAFAAERRTKEIGMRKVLGASVADIVRLLVWQFSRPVLIANLIGIPVAYYAMSRWLAGYRYRIALTDPRYLVLIFGGAAVVALAIAWLTTAGHAYRVARAKPGAALRVE